MVSAERGPSLPCKKPEPLSGEGFSDLVGGRIGSYQIEGMLGEGGMGQVFLARDEKLQRRVAIKRIRTNLPVDAHQRARFRREALAAARLSHPAIVHIYELLETPEGDCLVMERVEGRSLAILIAGRELDLRQVLRLGQEIAEGLAEAHTKGLIHRDLKPENVLVTQAGHAKIVDFGLARMLWSEAGDDDASDSQSGLTQVGTLIGTVHAMSPEQASGREVDHRSDLFALGGLLYEMLSGRAPFRGEHWLDSLRRVNAESPAPLGKLRPELPLPLIELVESLLRKEKEERPANARLVAEALDHLLQAGVAEAAPTALRPVPMGAKPALVPGMEELPTGEWPLPGDFAERGETALRALLRVERVESKGSVACQDPALRLEAATRELRRLREFVVRHGGVEVEKGEALLALFDRPADAVACALAHQRELVELSTGLGVALEARSAVHLGEVQLLRRSAAEVGHGARPLEVEGGAKNLVALLGGLAKPGQILLTQGAFDVARRAENHRVSSGQIRVAGETEGEALRWLAHGSYLIEGVDEPLEIFEVGDPLFSPLLPPAGSSAARRLLSASEERLLGWRPAIGQAIPLRPLWLLVERLGEGGFGEVWLARHKAGEQRVFKFCFDSERLRALKREVTLFRLLKEALGHRDDIARILDWQFDEAPFFVESEYTEGGNLVRWAEQQGGLAALPLTARLELAAEVAEALGAAHSVGILHKDVKPENVLITNDREGLPHARLTDFGIGLLTQRDRLASAGLTALGFTQTTSPADSGAGTVGYLAPELLEGKAASIQADIYSLGVLLYQLVVGDLKRTLAPGWERDIDDPLLAEDIALFVDGQPDRRPASAREVAEQLRTLEGRREARAEALQREKAIERAQHRRRWAMAAAAFLGAVLVVVAVMGLREYRARQLAEAAEKKASQRQRQAEDLIGFMLGDLRKKLDSVGRLDVLDAVGTQAMAYFAEVPAEDLSNEELARRARALYQIGEVRLNQGHLAAARASFTQAAALAATLVSRAPEHEESSFELAQTQFWLGQTELQQGKFQQSLDHFSEYLKIAEGWMARRQEDKRWQLEVAYASHCIAGALARLRKEVQALPILERSNNIKAHLLRLEPGDFEIEKSLANGLSRKGDLLFRLNRRAEAGEAFEAERLLREGLLARDPENAASIQSLATNRSLLGEMESSRGNHLAAVEAYRSAIGLFMTLVAKDPSNRGWQGELMTLEVLLGKSQTAARLYDEARKSFERANALATELAELDPQNQRWQNRLRQIREAREILESSSRA